MTRRIEVLHEALQKLHDMVHGGGKPAAACYGVCGNLGSLLMDADFLDSVENAQWFDEWLMKKFKLWPHWSGCIVYPVPHPDSKLDPSLNARLAYDCCMRWEDDDYGNLRRDLVRFLLEQVEGELCAND